MSDRPRNPRFGAEPKSAMNLWVQEALMQSGRTLQETADMLNIATGRDGYNKSTVQKMTADRGVRLDEAVAISKFTNFPLPRTLEYESALDGIKHLNDENQRTLWTLIHGLLATQSEPPSEK